MNTLQYIRSGDGTICIFCDGESFTVATDLIAYGKIVEGLEANTLHKQEILSLMNTQKAVAEIARHTSQGKVEVDLAANKVWYDGVLFPDKGLCDRILKLMADGHPFQFMVNFLERLGRNPNFRSVMELFSFISRKGFPITPEGKILAYKGINEDWTDCHSGRFDNHVGCVNKMDRKEGNDNHRTACSNGFHVGTYEYAVGFARGHVVLVEVDPADVICVPSCESDKMRCCEYKVIADHTGLSVLTGSVYDSTGKEVPASNYGQFDNETASHWGIDEGRTYDAQDREDDDLDDGAWDEDDDEE